MDRILREKEVKKATGVSRTTLWRWCNQGYFPQPIKLGENSTGWLASEVQDWITNRIKASRSDGV